MKILFLISYLLMMSLTGTAQLPKVSSGTLKRLYNFPSKYVTARNVDIWLPEGYSSTKKYPVLYMHDGQMLYDTSVTWNHQAWKIDDVISRLVSENKINEVIVVGVWNGGLTRHPDYFPQKPYESLTQTEKDTVTAHLQRTGKIKEILKPVSDNYLKFLVTELKPFIDKTYSTYKDRMHTFIAGSSMGGLISMYAICEYPKVFGGAACLSTHWPGIWTLKNNPVPDAFLKYLKTNLPQTKNHKIYFDCGDQTLDSLYPGIQKKVDVIMKLKGYTGKNWMTKYFPGENHSEKSWGKRVDIPLIFLLKK